MGDSAPTDLPVDIYRDFVSVATRLYAHYVSVLDFDRAERWGAQAYRLTYPWGDPPDHGAAVRPFDG
jgi:hypothetical protein